MNRLREALYRLGNSPNRYENLNEDIHTIYNLIREYEREHTLRIRYENINCNLFNELDDLLKTLNNLLKDKEVK